MDIQIQNECTQSLHRQYSDKSINCLQVYRNYRLVESLNHYFATHKRTHICNHYQCNCLSATSIKLISRLPNTLIIEVLPRDSQGQIILKNFLIPLSLDMAPYCVKGIGNTKYQLFAAIVFDMLDVRSANYYALVKKKLKKEGIY